MRICLVGLGYVGLPLAMALSKHFEVIGFDVNHTRISELFANRDSKGEVSMEELEKSPITYTSDPLKIKEANFIIIAVPTPIDDHNNPDLSPLISASRVVGENLTPHSIVVYESTVYPGCTEEVCVPLLEKYSHLKCGSDFKVGYSPERINPGDKEHTINHVTKIVSGMDEESLKEINSMYGKVTSTYCASSIKVAEAAKVIENIQRDLNMALMNELSIIFHKVGINTKEVLEAAGSKWNFHRYHPGLVGGHCIGVDPYYLTYKAQELGYYPEVILAGRRINDNMHNYVVNLLSRALNQCHKPLAGSKVLVLGLTFKADVKDCRNSRVRCLIDELKSLGANVVAFDPMLSQEEVFNEFKLNNSAFDQITSVDAVVLAVNHQSFKNITLDQLKKVMGNQPILIDIVNGFEQKKARDAGFIYESL